MKDAQGRVIYVGKAKNLRARAGSYFHKTAAEDRRICDWIDEVADIDHLPADSEVDALLMEARLIKDIQPKYNHDLKDDKTFPYLQITTGEDFPRVNFTREPKDSRGQALRAFPAGQEPARGDPGAPADLQVPDLLAGHRGGRRALAVVSALPAGLDQSVYGPVQPANRPRDLSSRHPPPPPLPRRQERRGPQGDGRGDAARPARRSSSRRRPGCATRSRPCRT